jgi:xanthine dehydrogenase small subunit
VAVRVARTPGVVGALADGLGPGVELEVEEIDLPGPPTSCRLRAAGWAEGVVLRAAVEGRSDEVVAPGGGRARAELGDDGTLRLRVDAGAPLDEVVLRSYCVGAAHMALGWVTSEGITVDEDGTPLDLTIRSFGVLRALDTPSIEVEIVPSGGPPRAVADAVFAAVAAATWGAQGFPPVWPTGRRLR